MVFPHPHNHTQDLQLLQGVREESDGLTLTSDTQKRVIGEKKWVRHRMTLTTCPDAKKNLFVQVRCQRDDLQRFGVETDELVSLRPFPRCFLTKECWSICVERLVDSAVEVCAPASKLDRRNLRKCRLLARMLIAC